MAVLILNVINLYPCYSNCCHRNLFYPIPQVTQIIVVVVVVLSLALFSFEGTVLSNSYSYRVRFVINCTAIVQSETSNFAECTIK